MGLKLEYDNDKLDLCERFNDYQLDDNTAFSWNQYMYIY